jgi:hypothetical protein
MDMGALLTIAEDKEGNKGELFDRGFPLASSLLPLEQAPGAALDERPGAQQGAGICHGLSSK